MSTVTVPSGSMCGLITPDSVSTRIDPAADSPLSRTKRANARAPLPHCSTSPPSALKMRYEKSAACASAGGPTIRIWSAPTPKRRSASQRHCAGASATGARVASSTTKSLPAPCILVNGKRIGRIIVDRGPTDRRR